MGVLSLRTVLRNVSWMFCAGLLSMCRSPVHFQCLGFDYCSAKVHANARRRCKICKQYEVGIDQARHIIKFLVSKLKLDLLNTVRRGKIHLRNTLMRKFPMRCMEFMEKFFNP